MTKTYAPKLTTQTNLEGVQRWRIVYHYRTGDSQDVDRVETVAWYHVTPEAAWADATALLSLDGCQQPHAITIERGTYAATPEGGYRWQQLHLTQHQRAGPTRHVPNHDASPDQIMPPTAHSAAVTATGTQHHLAIANPILLEDHHID